MEKVRFQKVGAGTFTFEGKTYKEGQSFLADPESIPAAFRDLVQPIAPIEFTPVVVQERQGFEMRQVTKSGFNVVNKETGKFLSVTVLSKKEAQKIFDSVTVPTIEDSVEPVAVEESPVESAPIRKPRAPKRASKKAS